MTDGINYRGPNRQYGDIDGANVEPPPTGRSGAGTYETFANMDHLRSLLATLRNESQIVALELESEMRHWYLDPKDMVRHDQKLVDAILQEWPPNVGDVEYIVPYDFYNALRHKSTASATYIRRTWEEQARGTAGALALDISKLMGKMINETDLISRFLDLRVEGVSDTSEFRVMELFQEWATVGIGTTRTLYNLYNKRDKIGGFSETDLSTITPDAAKRYASMLTVKVNGINEEIERALTTLDRNYFQYSREFYDKVLGPGMSFRLGVSEGMQRVGVSKESSFYPVKRETEAIFKDSLVDLVRRNESFTRQVEMVYGLMSARESQTALLTQMLSLGASAPVNTIKRRDRIVDSRDWDANVRRTIKPESLAPLHNKLDGREALDSHPQYLDRFGRNTIQSDIRVSDGIRIDGVDLSDHRHTGADGSHKIRGVDIEGLVATAIDRDAMVYPPEKFRLTKMEAAPSGGVNVTLSWEGVGDNVYDVNLAPVEGAATGAFSMVKRLGDIGDSNILNAQTHDGTTFACWTDDGKMYKADPDQRSELLFTELGMLNNLMSVFEFEHSFGEINFKDYEVDSNINIYLPYPMGGNVPDEGATYKRGMLVYSRSMGRWLNPEVDRDDAGYASAAVAMDHRQMNSYSLSLSHSDDDSLVATLIKVNGGRVTDVRPVAGWGSEVPTGLADLGTDGYMYVLTDNTVMKIHPARAEVESRVSIPNGLKQAMVGSRVNGFVALDRELLISTNSTNFDPNVKGSLQAKVYTLDIGGGDYTDITRFTQLSNPIGLTRDVYGRVYSVEFGSNEIYRVFGRDGTGAI